MATETQRLDPITFEVLRHKLDEITAEGYHTIGRVSGSPVVYESGDHQEAICTADGRLAAFGASVLHWVRSIGLGVKFVAERYAENPGFQDGDQFMVNDSYGAAVHASDVQLLAPVFWEGRLIAWAGTASHQMDTGGVNPGGHHVDAKDVYAEGFQTRGLKLVERGVIRADIEDTFANMVRTPEVGLLDIRAKVAANNVMKERLLGLVQRYGVDTILALFEQVIEYSEGRLRRRLADLPDGSWSAENYVEGIVEPRLGVRATVHKSGDALTFDYAGTSPQSAGPENMGVPGTESCAMVSLITMLCYDLPWNEGLFNPVQFDLPEGTLVNPIKPAPISATIPSGATLLVPSATEKALCKMLLESAQYRSEAHAGVSASKNYPVFAGLNQDGNEFTTLILDGNAGGGGALTDADGDDTAHNPWTVKTTIGNVETTEMLFPVLYLWRRELADTGGAGRYRGGLGMSDGMIVWRTGELVLVTVGTGTHARNTLGLAGGYPAANSPLAVLRGAGLRAAIGEGRLPVHPEEAGGERELISAKGMTMLGPDDVLDVVVCSGGGGYADPLLREPEAVARDIETGFVTVPMARDVYGVVVEEDGSVDGRATAARREEIRAGRLARATANGSSDVASQTCPECGSQGTLSFTESLEASEPERFAPPEEMFLLKHHCCARCATLVEIQLVPSD